MPLLSNKSPDDSCAVVVVAAPATIADVDAAAAANPVPTLPPPTNIVDADAAVVLRTCNLAFRTRCLCSLCNIKSPANISVGTTSNVPPVSR